MKRFLALIILGLLATRVSALDWYARGEFNGWNTDNLMTDLGGGQYRTTVTGLFDNTTFDYKIGTADWTASAPNYNGRVTSNAAGEITFNLFDNSTWTDGWSPKNQRRVGYSDPLEYDWEVMGSFNEFSTPISLTNQGNGLYSGQATFNAGIYDYKFRKAGDWSINMARDFQRDDPDNNMFSVASNGDTVQFDLDLPNGRLRAFTVTQHGDYNGDLTTNAADYVFWRKTMPGNAAKYTEWRNNYGRTITPGWIVHSRTLGDTTMADQGGGHYTATLTSLTVGSDYDYQVVRSDASSHFPGSIGRVRANSNGEVKLHFYELQTPTWTDGWSPADASRVGYEDHNQFNWELIGNFNSTNWDTPMALTNQGDGLYAGSSQFQAGTWYFKFREQGTFTTSIGDNFGNSATDNSFTVASDGDTWKFGLDLPHGRWRAYHPTAGLGSSAVPEPSSVVLAILGLVAICARFRSSDWAERL